MSNPNHAKSFIHELLLHRLYQIRDQLLLQDREYRELSEKPSQILQQLVDTLPPEERELLDEYDSGRNVQANREHELIYSRGVMDGIRLMDWIEQVNEGYRRNID
jgi:hypothetical protein